MSKQYGFVIDLKRCIGCDTCVVGCKMENSVGLGDFRLKVYDSQQNFQEERPTGTYPNLDMHWLPTMCHHCKDAPCVNACPTRALWRRDDDGMVVLEKDKCVGCQRCGEECPYGALSFNSDVGPSDKCKLCEHRVAEDKAPMCELVCPTRAIHFGDLNDTNSTVSQITREQHTQVLAEESGAQPQIFYLTPN